MYVYVRSEPNLFTVGFYDPDGKFHPESDWGKQKKAADRVHWLNGGIEREILLGNREILLDNLKAAIERFEEKLCV